MRDRFQFVIEKQLRHHEQESKGVDAVDERIDDPRVPAEDREDRHGYIAIWTMCLPLVIVVNKRVNRQTNAEWIEKVR